MPFLIFNIPSIDFSLYFLDCSVCIRKYLHYKNQCPACFQNVFEKDLLVNRSMDGIIKHYLQVRETILSLIENRSVYNTVKQLEQKANTPVRPARNTQLTKSSKMHVDSKDVKLELKTVVQSPTSSGKSKINASKSVIETEENQETIILNSSPKPSTSQSRIRSPITSKTSNISLPSIAKIFNTKKRENTVAVFPGTNQKTVMCPVCSVNISEQHINVHLDACLGREKSEVIVPKKVYVFIKLF